MKKYILLISLCIFSLCTIRAEITWTLSDDGTLTISGTDMPDYYYSVYYGNHIPWGSQCKEIKKIVINDGVTNIGRNVFTGCSALTSIIIPNSVTVIGDAAFYGCSALTSIIIPNSVTSIGGSAFSECSGLTSITIGNSVTTIGGQAFLRCSGLTSIIIPNSVTSIGSDAFLYCSGLKKIFNSSSLFISKGSIDCGYIAYYADAVYNNVSIDGNFRICKDDKGNSYVCDYLGLDESITLPKNVYGVADYAFSDCSGLTSVTIPYSVTNIGKNAFKNCSGVKEIYSWNVVPPVCSNDVFGEMSTQHTKVFVPEGSAEAYKYASGWKKFANIYEMSFSPIHSEAEPITVSDGAPTVTKGYYKENTVTYVREGAAISKDNYASFCLPFAVDPADAQFKAVYVPVGIALYNTETNTLRVGFYKAKDIIPAGTPFLARLDVEDKVEIKNALPVNYDANTPAIKTKTIRTFDFYERSGIMSENDSYSITFSGSYKKASPANACTFNTDGSAGPSASVSPFRAYISLSKNATNAKIIASFEDETETTGIKELLITNDKSPVYDLNGRIVNENVQKSGIYIKNGKKYIK